MWTTTTTYTYATKQITPHLIIIDKFITAPRGVKDYKSAGDSKTLFDKLADDLRQLIISKITFQAGEVTSQTGILKQYQKIIDDAISQNSNSEINPLSKEVELHFKIDSVDSHGIKRGYDFYFAKTNPERKIFIFTDKPNQKDGSQPNLTYNVATDTTDYAIQNNGLQNLNIAQNEQIVLLQQNVHFLFGFENTRLNGLNYNYYY